MANLLTAARPVWEDEAPADQIWRRVNTLIPGDTVSYIDGYDVGGQDVLVGVFEPATGAKIGKLGLLVAANPTRDEYRWQGCTGLVLKLGPLAYQTEKTERWFCNRDRQPAPPVVGQWVMFDVKTSHSFLLGDQPVRLVAAQYVMGRIRRPDMVA